MKKLKFNGPQLILSLAGLLVISIVPNVGYCADSQLGKIISLFNSGVYVSQTQIENALAGERTSILREESLHRYYRTSFSAPSSQIRELRFGSHREDAQSQKWIVGSLSAFFPDSKIEGCETYDDLVKSMGFAERMREPRSSIKGASWTRPATLSKGPYVISISTTDVTKPCVSGLTIVEEKIIQNLSTEGLVRER
nr:hypothetical protein M3O59_009110 [Xanthomonas nasturtii]